MFSSFHKLVRASLICTAFVASASQAGPVLGDSVSCGVSGGGTFSCSSAAETVGNGVEFQVGNLPGAAYFNIDFSDGLLTAFGLNNGSLSATILHFSDLTTPFSSASFVGQTGFTGLDVGDFTFSAGELMIDLRGTSFSQGSQFSVAFAPTPSAVPEPGTIALLGLGLIGIVAARKRKQA